MDARLPTAVIAIAHNTTVPNVMMQLVRTLSQRLIAQIPLTKRPVRQLVVDDGSQLGHALGYRRPLLYLSGTIKDAKMKQSWRDFQDQRERPTSSVWVSALHMRTARTLAAGRRISHIQQPRTIVASTRLISQIFALSMTCPQITTTRSTTSTGHYHAR
jgi:hypothetical protein